MKKQLAITDVTRMQRGCVCVAGYDKDGVCIRPTLPPPGIRETSLLVDGQPIIFPFAVVEFDLVSPQPDPPHTEDCHYDPKSVKFLRRVKDEKRESLLERSLFDGVDAIFEQTIHRGPGFYVMDGCGPRSIGTLLPDVMWEVIYEEGDEGNWDYRLRFRDGRGKTYGLKITDLTWHYYCDSLRDENHTSTEIARDLSRDI